jgi:hypothetical protein
MTYNMPSDKSENIEPYVKRYISDKVARLTTQTLIHTGKNQDEAATTLELLKPFFELYNHSAKDVSNISHEKLEIDIG